MTSALSCQHCPAIPLAALNPLLVLLGHEAWARALMHCYAAHINGRVFPPVEYRFLNLYQVKLAPQQAHLRVRNTHPRNLVAKLDLLLRSLGRPTFLPTGAEVLVR